MLTKRCLVSQETLTKTLFTQLNARGFEDYGMSKWVGVTFGLACLVAIAALVYYVDLVPVGQLVAVLASAVVAVLGFWVFFRKPSQQKDRTHNFKLNANVFSAKLDLFFPLGHSNLKQ
jgi:membrane protein YdbS with pleckstrin-like domain